jgi:hypothetical protein
MKRVLAIDDNLALGEDLDLSDDHPAWQLFWCTLLDRANAHRVEEVGFCPNDRDNCITMLVEGHTYPGVPLPYEAQEMALRYAQEIALGQWWYTILVRLSSKPITRERREPILIQVGDRQSKWSIRCTRDSIRFLRYP